ncbi:MAG: TetR/AcrR family transcriptional regulator [Gemmataceae bacterium]|nr:TetR/AcrR family transcriptional regulator [Gemmataceae bacterium]
MGKSRRAKSRRKRAYHHGDLRTALIDAGLDLVARRGVQALSLRAVARHAQVSHAAPYHHFADKAELLAAVAAAGFDRMVAAIAQATVDHPPRSALEGLRAVGVGYLRFAFTHPAIFRLMFRPELTRPAAHPVLQNAEARAFGTLLTAIRAAQRAGELPGNDPAVPATFAWSTVHGLAVLHVDQVLRETPLGAVPIQELADAVVQLSIAGLQAAPRPEAVNGAPR